MSVFGLLFGFEAFDDAGGDGVVFGEGFEGGCS